MAVLGAGSRVCTPDDAGSARPHHSGRSHLRDKGVSSSELRVTVTPPAGQASSAVASSALHAWPEESVICGADSSAGQGDYLNAMSRHVHGRCHSGRDHAAMKALLHSLCAR